MPIRHYQLAHWLRDAYAMELQSVDMLSRQLRAIGAADPALQKRLEFHLEETRDQAEKIKICLEHLGSNVQNIKMGLSRLIGNMQAVSAALEPDDKIKTMVLATMFEQFEISCYETLIIAATEAGEQDVADTCRRIMAQERLMQMWLEKHLPYLVRDYLQQQAARQTPIPEAANAAN